MTRTFSSAFLVPNNKESPHDAPPFQIRPLHVAADERVQAANPSVDSSAVRLSTALTPRDDTDESSRGGGNDGAAAVSLARVLTSRG